MQKPITNTWMITTLKNRQHLYLTWIWMICMVGQWVSIFLMVGLSGIHGFDVNSISEKSPIGYFLEVDIKYPDELHELHNDYPLAPKNMLFLVICCQLIVKKLLLSMK